MGTRKEPPLQNILTSQKYLNSQKKSSFLKFCFPLLLPKPVLKKMFLRPLFFLPLDCALCVFLGQAAICLKREEENLSSLMTPALLPSVPSLCPFTEHCRHNPFPILQLWSRANHSRQRRSSVSVHAESECQNQDVLPDMQWFDLAFSISPVGLLWSAKWAWRPVPWLYCLLPVLSVSIIIVDIFMSVSDPTSPQPSSPVKTEARESEKAGTLTQCFCQAIAARCWAPVLGSGSLSYLVYTSLWNCISSSKLLPDLVQRRLVAVKYKEDKFSLVLHWWNWESDEALN